MKVYKYKWTKGFRADPQEAGAMFQRLRSDEAVLEDARNPENPIHNDLPWDDTAAAKAHRLHIIRTMRASLLVEVITKESKPQHIRAFVRTIDKSSYVPTLEASVEEMGAAEKVCWIQMKTFRAKWKNLQFAKEVIEAIADKERQVQRSVRKRHA